jgi:hypothetical protein
LNTGRRGWLLALGLGVAVAWASGGPLRLLAGDGEPGRLTVHVDRPGATIGRMHFGLMTEEINHANDGGLYAELVRNRIFKDDPKTPVHWSAVASPGAAESIALDAADPVNATALTTSLRLDITTAGPGQRVGVANEGYWGIPVRPHTQYRASFYARAGGGFGGPLTVAIESNDGTNTAASASVPAVGAKWQQYTATLTTGQVAASPRSCPQSGLPPRDRGIELAFSPSHAPRTTSRRRTAQAVGTRFSVPVRALRPLRGAGTAGTAAGAPGTLRHAD